MKAIMIVGTTSHAGKSLLTAAICRILSRRGWRVAPFKGQNMALNAYVTANGGEIGYAQAVQAWAAGVIPWVEMNPILLKPQGVITMEFPHLMRLMEENQFDTIYHEHFSYLSLLTVEKLFAEHGLTIFDVEELSTHGGSLRIYARQAEDTSKPISQQVKELRAREEAAGFSNIKHYFSFGEKVKETKFKLLEFLISAKRQGKIIAGYGAPGKGNTLLNYCGIREDFIDYTVDRNPYKQGKFLPGTHIPIFHPDKIQETKPDYLLILPWNLKNEIMSQMSYVRDWGCQFIVPIPEVNVYS